MEPELRLLLGIVLVPAGAVFGLAASFFFTGVVDYYGRGLSVLLRNTFSLSGAWSEGIAPADGVAVLARYVAGACFWLAIWWAVFLSPDRQWVVDGLVALAFLATVTVWIPSAFLREVFRGPRRRSPA